MERGRSDKEDECSSGQFIHTNYKSGLREQDEEGDREERGVVVNVVAKVVCSQLDWVEGSRFKCLQRTAVCL